MEFERLLERLGETDRRSAAAYAKTNAALSDARNAIRASNRSSRRTTLFVGAAIVILFYVSLAFLLQ